jgi:hypothetical protein
MQIVRLFLLLVTGQFLVLTATGQTCSCAGAPLLGAQGGGAAAAGQWVFGLTYEHHDISSVFTGSTSLPDGTVSRLTRSFLLEASYGLTDRLSVAATFTYVMKDRVTGLASVVEPSRVRTNGIGDGIVLLRYAIRQPSLWNRYGLSAGLGGKMPIGASSQSHRGFQLNADMQPGTGAWDGVIWGETSVSFLPLSTASASVSSSYRHTGTNSRFTEDDRYRFGNEFIATLTVADALAEWLAIQPAVRFRSTSSDRLNGISMPNTGGRWLEVITAADVGLADGLIVRFSGRVPVYQHLSGTQPTTTYALSASVFINLKRRSDGFIQETN